MHKILVADDERPVRKLISSLLDQEEYEIIEATNGKEAIELVTAEKIMKRKRFW